MDLKEIKRIITMVEEANISSLSLETKDAKIEISKSTANAIAVAPQQQYGPPVSISSPESTPQPEALTSSEPRPVAEDKQITSPMVGTFYSAPNPESQPYVKEGDSVSSGQVICIIEAMKLFNEIEAEVSGVIEKVLVESGSPVEYGQPLFLIR